MRLIVDQSLATGFISINALQQRASLSFKPGVLERKVYNNDEKTFFSVLTFAKPSCYNVVQPLPLQNWGYNTLSHSTVRAATHYHTWAKQTLIHRKEEKNVLSS